MTLNKKHIINSKDLGFLLLWFIVAVYPLLVIRWPLYYFTGQRYIILAVVSLVALIILNNKKEYLNNIAYYPLSVFLTFAFLSTILSNSVMATWVGSPMRFTGYSTYIFCAVLFVIASKSNATVRIINAMLFCSSAVAMIAVLQHFGFDLISYGRYGGNIYGFHSYGTLGNPNVLGVYMVFIIPASIMLYLYQAHIKWLFVSALIFAAILTSLTRGAWIAFALLFVLIIWHVYSQHELKLRVNLAKLVLVFAITFLLISLTQDQVVYSRSTTVSSELESAIRLEDSAGSNRMYVWKESLRRIPYNWAFGIGPDNLRIALSSSSYDDKAHNIFLEIAVTMGLFALIAYLSFIYFCLKERRRDFYGNTLLFMVIAYLAAGQFNIDAIQNLPLFFIVLGLLLTKESYRTAVFSDSGLATESNMNENHIGMSKINNIYYQSMLLVTALLIIMSLFFLYILASPSVYLR